MFILYALLIAYILSVNFYAFLLVKSLRDQDRATVDELPSSTQPNQTPPTEKPPEKFLGRLFATGALGGALTIYICMFIFKYKRDNLLLMVFMPMLAVLNIYLFVLLFRSGFSFFVMR
ncbi:MAG: hypothetical protein J6A38_03045 [Clostridia bacterium]|nr:hypothetical protein [Clostridia bacterium]